jgi:hypothetical protein
MPVQGYILSDVARFPRGSVQTHHPCAIHPFSTDEGKPHMTPLGWGVGPRSPTYSETDLPQGRIPGYPPPADVPGSHSSLRFAPLVNISSSLMKREVLVLYWEVHESTECTHHFHRSLTIHFCSITFLFKRRYSRHYPL